MFEKKQQRKEKPMTTEAMKILIVEITFTEEVLGTASSNKDIHSRFVASKAPDAPSMEEEVEAVGVTEVEQLTKTIFSRDKDGTPMLWDYQLKGFFKDSCGSLRRVKGTKSEKMKEEGQAAFKKIIDGLIFPFPRRIRLQVPEKEEMGDCQRPIRAQTPKGERVALANSEALPEGTSFVVKIRLLDGGLQSVVEEWLDYGELRGLGAWRNSGKGRFTWRYVDEGEGAEDKKKGKKKAA